jgi:tetratricopeptide (TPR) repeat protein
MPRIKTLRLRTRLFQLAWILLAGDCTELFAEDPTPAAPPAVVQTETNFAARANRIFTETRLRYHADTNNQEAAWQFARACFDWAEFAPDNNERAKLAESGIAASRQAIGLKSASAPAHYYLGMNLGQLARTKTFGALKLVYQMESEFDAARQLDELFDYAGPDRNLGLLYREAPSFGSIGSRSKARQHLRRAVELAPDYPENRLNLIETYLQWGDHTGPVSELKALEDLWPAATKKSTSDEWAPSWADWQNRFSAVKKKIQTVPKNLESPRDQQ